MSATKWTVTSPDNKILYGELEGENVLMSSAKGNHGSVTLPVWLEKVQQMADMGYKVEAN